MWKYSPYYRLKTESLLCWGWGTTLQTLDSDDLVPLSMNVSDLIRALSDLCIQAYQQLLSITEKRLQNIIGAVTLAMSALYPLPFV